MITLEPLFVRAGHRAEPDMGSNESPEVSDDSCQLRIDLDRLLDICRAIGEDADARDTLQLIVDRLCEQSVWSMANLVMLDEPRGTVEVVAQHGMTESFAIGTHFPATGSASFAALQGNRPLLCEDALGQAVFPVAEYGARVGGFRSFIALPLPLAAPRAVINVFSKDAHHFTPREVAYMEAIASQAAVATRAAQLYEREHTLRAELADVAERYQVQNAALERALREHAELMGLVLEGRGLQTITRTLAGLVGNPVVVENSRLRFLSSARSDSDTPPDGPPIWALGHSVAAASGLYSPQWIERESRQYGVARLPAHEKLGLPARLIIPVMAGKERLAYVTVAECNRTLDAADVMTVERAAMVCALHLLQERAAFEVEMRLKADFLADLLTGRESSEGTLITRAAFLGFDFVGESTLLVIDVDDFESFARGREQRAVEVKRELLTLVDQTASGLSRSRLVVPLSDCIVAIVPLGGGSPVERRKRAAALAHELQERVACEVPDISVSVGIGRECSDWSSVPGAHADVMKALRVVRNLDRRNQIVAYDQLGIWGVLLRPEDTAELLSYPRSLLEPLEKDDQRQHGHLLKTLEEYLWLGGNAQAVARKLDVHVNTVYHRLQRIRDVLEIELDDPDLRLELQLAFKINALVGTNEPMLVSYQRGASATSGV